MDTLIHEICAHGDVDGQAVGDEEVDPVKSVTQSNELSEHGLNGQGIAIGVPQQRDRGGRDNVLLPLSTEHDVTDEVVPGARVHRNEHGSDGMYSDTDRTGDDVMSTAKHEGDAVEFARRWTSHL